MPKKHQYIAKTKKTRTGQYRKARRKETQYLNGLRNDPIQRKKKHKVKELKDKPIKTTGFSIAPLLLEALENGFSQTKLT